jgi:succinoglycan biosynthesis transport protein ExoP
MAVSKFPAPHISQDANVSQARWGFLRPERDLDLRELGRKLWRRKNVVLGITALGTVASVLILMQMTPLYTARSTVMVDPRQDKVLNMEAVLSGLPADQETIESEIEVLTSRGLAERVVKKLSLYGDPEFNGRLRPPTMWSELRAALSPRNLLPAEFLEMIGIATGGPPLTEEQILENERIATIDELIGKMDVRRVGRSRVIGISVKLADAGRAAEVANTVADLYIVEQLEAKFEATRRATEWLNDRLSGLRLEVQRTEQAVEAFRKNSGLVEGKGVTLASQQASELNSQLILSRSRRAEADARLRQVEGLIRSSSSVDSVAEVLNSPLIQQLRTQEAEIQRRAAELSQEFGEKHPRMINIRAEIANIRTKINAEVNKIVQNLRNEVAVAQAREAALRESLQGLEAKVANLNQSEVQLRALEREAKANRALYETFLGRFKETHEQQEFQKPDARIISHADRPTAPSAPKKGLIAAFAFVLFAALGVAVAFLLESLDKGFRSMEEIEGTTGIPALGLVPALTGLVALRKEPQDIVLERPNSAFTESVRALHAGILLSNVDNPPRTVLMTSSLPSEGKTSLSLSLTRLVARTGAKKVIIVDCDLRRPLVHRHLGMDIGPGLVQLLAEEVSMEQALRRDPGSGAWVLTAGGTPANPTDIITSEHFSRLLGTLRTTFDLVVLDSSPVLAVSDSRILSRMADKTIFVVRWAETRREVVRLGLKQIVEAGADLAGVVLSMVNVKKHSRYGYGDSGYYYGRYRKYYTN